MKTLISSKLRAYSRPAALMVATALLFAACRAADSPTAPPSAAPRVTGTVSIAQTGQPVVGAAVSNGIVTAITGADGRFELKGLYTGAMPLTTTATGYESVQENITVAAGTLNHDLKLKRIENFDIDGFAIHIPATVSTTRGILVALGGPDTRGFASGVPFGAPFPPVEAALQSFGQELRAMAASRGLAVLGTSQAAMTNGAASDKAILLAIDKAALLSGRAELGRAPILMYGISGGGPEAAGFTARNPDRIAGLFLKAPLRVESLTSGPVLEIPTYVLLAELDAFIDNAALRAAFTANRGNGALWALATEARVPHHALSPGHAALTKQWMDEILGLRLGAAASDKLRPIQESSGWIGEPSSGQVMAWSAYTGNGRSANWFPTQTTAMGWRNFIGAGQP